MAIGVHFTVRKWRPSARLPVAIKLHIRGIDHFFG